VAQARARARTARPGLPGRSEDLVLRRDARTSSTGCLKRRRGLTAGMLTSGGPPGRRPSLRAGNAHRSKRRFRRAERPPPRRRTPARSARRGRRRRMSRLFPSAGGHTGQHREQNPVALRRRRRNIAAGIYRRIRAVEVGGQLGEERMRATPAEPLFSLPAIEPAPHHPARFAPSASASSESPTWGCARGSTQRCGRRGEGVGGELRAADLGRASTARKAGRRPSRRSGHSSAIEIGEDAEPEVAVAERFEAVDRVAVEAQASGLIVNEGRREEAGEGLGQRRAAVRGACPAWLARGRATSRARRRSTTPRAPGGATSGGAAPKAARSPLRGPSSAACRPRASRA
jgi:hypothetical protein